MTIPMVLPFSAQRVIDVSNRQRAVLREEIDHALEVAI
jgi:hypothetical protein